MSTMPLPPRRRRGIFGPMMEVDGVPPMPSTIPGTMAPDAAPIATDAHIPSYKKPGTAQMIVGSIGDALQNWSGGKGTFLPGLAAQQQAVQDYAAQQRQRAEGFADWEQREKWKRANPEPSSAQPYRFSGNDGDVYELGPDGKPKKLFDDPDPKIDYQWIRNADGTMSGVPIPRGGSNGAPAGPPPGVTFSPLPPSGGAAPGPRTFRP